MSSNGWCLHHPRLALATALAMLCAVLAGTGVSAHGATPAGQDWVKRFNGGGGDAAFAMGVSPDGSRVFVTGQSEDSDGTSDYVTIAYKAITGTKLWASRYDMPFTGFVGPTALAVSPNGRRLFVTGNAATVAYDAHAGAQLWAKGNRGSGHGLDGASDLAVSPNGGTVFVAGSRMGSGGADDYATVAYDASTGARRWIKRYDGPANGGDDASALGVSPDGSRVFVTGASWGSGPLPTSPPLRTRRRTEPGSGCPATTGRRTPTTTQPDWA